MDDTLGAATAARVLERLGLPGPPDVSGGGLKGLYRAWCLHVPFENSLKRLALAAPGRAPLPGATAEEFFDSWLTFGTGGTCWPTSNALYTLLVACGFEARRVSGSMFDVGEHNHGSVIVRLDGADWIVDSSMLTDVLVPLRPGQSFERADPVHPVAAEPSAGGWLISFGYTLSRDTMPWRLLRDPVDHAFYQERHEDSRARSLFNVAVYARRNRPDGLVSLVGPNRFFKGSEAITADILDAEGVARVLVEEIGIASEIVSNLKSADLLG